MSAMIRFRVDDEETLRGLRTLVGDKLPFANARALTLLAKDAQGAVQETTRQEFRLHTEFIPKGIGILPAKKSEMRSAGESTAYVYTRERISSFMPIHEYGGTRDPSARGSGDKGKSLAIPAEDLKDRSYQTSTGAVRKRYKPQQLLKDYDRTGARGGNVQKTSRGGRKGAPFIIRGRSSGVPMIVRRKSKRRMPLELLYIFSKRAQIDPTWGFEDVVNAVVSARYQERFRESYIHTLGEM